jgi:hypothetical protein
MFMMFDHDVWFVIVITFTLSLVLIQVLNFCSKKVQDLVFGEGVRIPTINFFGTIFGIGQTRLPRKSFPRFLLMMFIILCLILRTCHQSLLYDLMQKDLRRAELKTIDEAIEKGHKFYMQDTYINRYKNADFYDKIKIVDIGLWHGNFSILLKYAHKTVDHEFDGVVAFTTEDIDIVERDSYRTGVSSLRMMVQKTGNFPLSFKMHRESVLVKPYNEMILRLFEAGITEFLDELYYKRGQKIEAFGPQVLDFDHLGACFLVCATPLILAVIAFFFESLFKNCGSCCKRQIEKSSMLKSFIRKKLQKINCKNIRNRPRKPISRKQIKEKITKIKTKCRTFAENYKDFQQKVKFSGLDCLKLLKEKSLHENLSDCFRKKKSLSNVPKNIKFIQVQPRNSEI